MEKTMRGAHLVLVAALAGLSAAEASEPKRICSPRSTDESTVGTPIQEADLTAKAASKAIADLETRRVEDPDADGHHWHIVRGNLKVVRGYLLKYEAEVDGRAGSVGAFCGWLQK